jgi:transcriptional repressor NrdR
MINNLESERSTDRTEISSQDIWEDVLKAVKAIDIVAYIRFASVYKAFDNLEDFQGFIK